MIERELLLNVFTALVQANPRDRDTEALLGAMNDGSFFKEPPVRQLSIIQFYHEAYLGRGDLITGLVWSGLVSKSFADEMDIAFLWYLLTLDLPESQKAAMRNHLSRMQSKLPE
jgi:hypothetical protein